MASVRNLEQYRRQRQQRKRRRDNFLQKIAQVEKRIPVTMFQLDKNENQMPEPGRYEKAYDQNTQNQQQTAMAEQNIRLKSEVIECQPKLEELEGKDRESRASFAPRFNELKNLYLNKIRQISEEGKKQKDEYMSKISDLNIQHSSALQKTREIEAHNKRLEVQISQSEGLGQKYFEQIEQQYAAKLKEFEQVLEASNAKIQAVEQKMEYEELADAALNNEELVNEIRESAQKNAPQIDRIYADYEELLRTKQDILNEMRENNRTKQEEIGKTNILEAKLRQILQKLNQEREIYLDQNKKMSGELMEIQALLDKVMGAAIE